MPSKREYESIGVLRRRAKAKEAELTNDIVSTLARELRPREIVVLRGLAEGIRLLEIAVRLKRSYPTVLSYRRKIAKLAVKRR